MALGLGGAGPAWNGAFDPIPGGSYQMSCRDVTAFGGYVYAVCRDSWGGWQESSIPAGMCPGAIMNDNGRLSCGGPSGPPPWSNGCRRNETAGLIVYENPDYKGARQELCDSSPNLAGSGLDDEITSVRVLKGTWLLCAGRDFNGQCWTVSADTANLKDMGANDKVSSIRRIGK